MKTFLLTIFLTAVALLLDSGVNKAWGAEKPQTIEDIIKNCEKIGRIWIPGAPTETRNADGSITYTPTGRCEANADAEKTKKQCDDKWADYRKEVKEADKKYDEDNKELKKKFTELQEKFQDAEEKGQRALDDIQEAFITTEKDYAAQKKEMEEKSSSNKQSLQEDVRSLDLKLHELNTQKILAHSALGIAQNNLLLAKTEPNEMLQLECLEKVRSSRVKKGSIQNGGANAAFGGADFMSRLFAACMQMKMKERKADLDKLSSEVQARDAAEKALTKQIQTNTERFKDLKTQLAQFDFKAAQAAAETEANHKKDLERLNQKYLKQKELMTKKQQQLSSESQQVISEMGSLRKNTKELDSLGIDIEALGSIDVKDLPKKSDKKDKKEKPDFGGACCTKIEEDDLEEYNDPESDYALGPKACPTVSGEKKDSGGSFMDNVLQQLGTGIQ